MYLMAITNYYWYSKKYIRLDNPQPSIRKDKGSQTIP